MINSRYDDEFDINKAGFSITPYGYESLGDGNRCARCEHPCSGKFCSTDCRNGNTPLILQTREQQEAYRKMRLTTS